MRRLVYLLILIALTSGCVTRHHPKSSNKGLATLRRNNVFRVEFSDKDFTELSKARDFALLRCAEITIENG
jgi:hypothetical protein